MQLLRKGSEGAGGRIPGLEGGRSLGGMKSEPSPNCVFIRCLGEKLAFYFILFFFKKKESLAKRTALPGLGWMDLTANTAEAIIPGVSKKEVGKNEAAAGA